MFCPVSLTESTAFSKSCLKRLASSIYKTFLSARLNKPGAKRFLPCCTAYSISMLPKSISSVTLSGRLINIRLPAKALQARAIIVLPVPLTPVITNPPVLWFTSAIKRAFFIFSCPTTAAKG